MSADNVIYVKKFGPEWVTWHDFASNDRPRPHGCHRKAFPSKAKALKYAFHLVDNIGYVEHGVNLL